MINKRNIFYLLGIFMSIAILTLKESNLSYLIAASIVLFFSILQSRFNLSSPAFWWISGIFLYGFSGSILEVMGFYSIGSINTLRISYISLIFSSIAITIASSIKSVAIRSLPNLNNASLATSKQLYLISLALLLLILIYQVVYLRGLNKVELTLMGLNRFEIFNSLLAAAYGIYLFNMNKNSKIYKFMTINVTISLMASLVNGERDLFVSIIVISLSYLTFNYMIKTIYLLSSILGFVAIFTVLQNYRSFFTTGAAYSEFSRPFLVEVLLGEPISAFRNTEIIQKANIGRSEIERLAINDTLAAVFPKFIIYIENSSIWFNNKFFKSVVDMGGGQGFTLFGSFYLYGGLIGVASLSFLVSFVITRFYKLSQLNSILLPLYCASIVSLIFSIRADLSVTIGGPVRIITPAIILFLIIRKITVRRKDENFAQYS